MSIVFSSCFTSLVVGCGVLHWAFFLVLSWQPSAVGTEWGKNLRMLLSVTNVHVGRLLLPMTFRSVLFLRLPMDICRKLRVSLMVQSGRTALICGSSFGMDVWGLDALGNIHILVAGPLYPVKIVRPPFDTCTFCFVNINSHPLSHNTGIETRGSLHIFELTRLLHVIWQSVNFHLA